MKPRPTILAAAALAVTVLSTAPASRKPNPLFTDGAVLQRGQPVPVWQREIAGSEKLPVPQ
jgi:hypothetical protein